MELSYRYGSERPKSLISRLYLQLGLGSVFSGKVLKNEASGNDLLSSYNSNHSVLGSTQFGAAGYNFEFFQFIWHTKSGMFGSIIAILTKIF